MAHNDDPVALTSFVERHADRPDRARVVETIGRGHETGEGGWCRHPVHDVTGQPEQHPCATNQLVAMIRRRIRELPDGRAAAGTADQTGPADHDRRPAHLLHDLDLDLDLADAAHTVRHEPRARRGPSA